MKKLFTLLLAVSLLFSIAATSAAAEGTGGTMYPNPLQDVRVRQALWYAIDMDAIVDALWNGTVTAAHKSLVPEGYWQANGLTEYTYNPEKAKELLAEAGWDGSRTLKAVYYTGNLLDTITAIQAYWNDVGVKMEFQLLTDNLTALLWTPSADGMHSAVDWDLCFAGTNALTLGEFYNRHHSTAVNNSTVKPDETLDKLIEASRVAVTKEDQKVAYDAIQVYENERVPVIPMFYIPSWVVTSKHLDMQGNPVGNDQFSYRKNILDWTTDREDRTLYTNTGAVNALEHPATNPGLFWHQEIVFDRLLNADESLAPTDGSLAESYEVSADGKTIAFKIRENVKWHDGTPFTAEDVAWTFRYYPTVPGANTVMTDVVNDAKAITVDGNDGFAAKPVGTGPFKVETVKLGEYTILSRNADYFMPGTGNIEKLYLYPSTDAGDENLITNAKAGMIDYAFCKDSTQVQQLLEMSDYTVYTVNVTFPRYIFVNMFER